MFSHIRIPCESFRIDLSHLTATVPPVTLLAFRHFNGCQHSQIYRHSTFHAFASHKQRQRNNVMIAKKPCHQLLRPKRGSLFRFSVTQKSHCELYALATLEEYLRHPCREVEFG